MGLNEPKNSPIFFINFGFEFQDSSSEFLPRNTYLISNETSHLSNETSHHECSNNRLHFLSSDFLLQ